MLPYEEPKKLCCREHRCSQCDGGFKIIMSADVKISVAYF